MKRIFSLMGIILIGMNWILLKGAMKPENQKYWIFFNSREPARLDKVSDMYIQNLFVMGIKPVYVSNWLNAVSAFVPQGEKNEIQSLPYVLKIQPVRSFPLEKPIGGQLEKPWGNENGQLIHRLDYGTSLTQNSLIHVPEVHDLGLTGKGIKIGILDAGFDYRNHSVFSHLNVLGEHDFVFNDSNTANEGNDSRGEDDHGTETLSVIAGFEEGELVGPAYESSFALAKTEWVPTETRIEEDQWVAGLEWVVDSMHVQIVSTSLGYHDFDNGFEYTFQDMNGNTCVTTIAADLAVKKGVTVVASAGNERNKNWHYVNSPADGDSVIAAGAVTSGGNLADFSSGGPTADGRIKPDVVTMGVGVYMVNPSRSGKSSYLFANGTSFSAPQVAGVCALILQAHPELSPIQIREALWKTSDRAMNPDTLFGYGLVNAYDAVFFHGPIFTNFQTFSMPMSHVNVIQMDILTRDDEVLDSANLFYQTVPDRFINAALKSVSTENSKTYQAFFSDDLDLKGLRFYITAQRQNGERIYAPIGAPQTLYAFEKFTDTRLVTIPNVRPVSFQLHPNFPNPFNNSTTIGFDLIQQSRINVRIFNIKGQTVSTLFDGMLESGKIHMVWNGKAENGHPVASGLYFCVVQTEKERKIQKMTLIK